MGNGLGGAGITIPSRSSSFGSRWGSLIARVLISSVPAVADGVQEINIPNTNTIKSADKIRIIFLI